MKTKKETWNLKDLYSSNKEWIEQYNLLRMKIINIKDNINSFTVNKLIKSYEEILEINDSLKGYIKLKYDGNIEDKSLDNFLYKIQDIDMEISKLTAIINSKIISRKKEIDILYSKYLEDLLEEQKTTVESRILYTINKEMFISEKNFNKLLNNLKFKQIKDTENIKYNFTLNLYSKYMRSKDRILRKNAFIEIEETLKTHSNAFFKCLYKYIYNNIKLSEILGYKNSLSRSLKTEEISTVAYNICINYINKNKDIFERYIEVKRKKLKVEKIQIFDLYVPMFQENNNVVTYKNAKNIIKEALSVLGEEYITVVEKIFNDKWIDVFERKNKITSAYSYSIYGKHPYILLNFQYNLNDIFILAHEIGHAVHYYFANTNQSYINAKVTSLETEIAAMTNECLVYEYLLQKKKNNKEDVINLYLDKFMTILCKQSIFNKFETTIYNEIEGGNKLDARKLSKMYSNIFRYYYGNDIEIKNEIYEWTKILHFYKNFQVYKYLIAFCIAINISTNIEALKNNYIYMLKLGRTKNIEELLKLLNIDLEKDNLYEETFKKFEELISKLESDKFD